LEIAAFGVENGDALICHFGFGGKKDLEFADIDKTATITAGGFTYRLDLFTGWDNRNVVTVFVTHGRSGITIKLFTTIRN